MEAGRSPAWKEGKELEWKALLVHGLLDDGGAAGGAAPVAPSSLLPRAHAAKNKHRSSFELLSWGAGYQGQLGSQRTSHKTNLPVRITLPDDEEPCHVACAGVFSAAVTTSGTVYTWGTGKQGQLGFRNATVCGLQPQPMQVTGALSEVPITAIACGREHMLALSFSGNIFSWGSSKYGQLGHGDHHSHAEPRLLEVGGEKTFSCIAAGDQHSAALCDGKLYTWGSGTYGQLGHGETHVLGTDELQILRPTKVDAMDRTLCRSVVCGSVHTGVITVHGQMQVCGIIAPRVHGVVSTITTEVIHYTPVELPLPHKAMVKDVACGKSHILLLAHNGDVFSLGSGAHNQLGHGKVSDLSKPRLILQGKDIVRVAAGRYHSVAITAHGAMYTWGQGEHGQLGHGTDTSERFPKLVSSVVHRALLEAECGDHHMVALCTAPLFDGGDDAARLPSTVATWLAQEQTDFEKLIM